MNEPLSDSREIKVFKSPKSLIKSPRFQDILFTRSPSLRTTNTNENFVTYDDSENNINDDAIITEDQIYNEVVDIIVNEEQNIWIIGLLMLFACVIFWILSLQILNNVMKNTDFDHPLLAAYFNGSFFILFGLKPLFQDFEKLVNPKNEKANDKLCVSNENYNSNDQNDNDSVDLGLLNTPNIRLSHSQIVKVSIVASFLYFLNCYLGSAALKYTSASNQTILATSSSIFSLIFGILFKIEKFTLTKSISVLCSMFGIILITSSTTTNLDILSLSREKFGDLLAIVGACSYSGFLTLLRIKLGEQTNSDSDSLLYGYMGFSTLIGILPILLIYNYFNWEPLILPDNIMILAMLLTSSLLNSLSDYFASKASLIASPLAVSLSLSMAIPVNMYLDSYFNSGLNFSIKYLVGITLIFSSFLIINISNENEIVENAIENAIEEAINYDENLSLLLSPNIKPTESNNNTPLLSAAISSIPNLSINAVLDDSNLTNQPRLVVTGGQNHKYFFREIKD